jgi:hypothetical protein
MTKRVAVLMKEKEKRPNIKRQSTSQPNETEKTVFNAGPSYDFWNSEGDSIYDELYGDEV